MNTDTSKKKGEVVVPAQKRWKQHIALGISIVCGIAGLLIFTIPFIPTIDFWLFPPDPDLSANVLFNRGASTNPQDKSIPIEDTSNRLLIPKIGVDALVLESDTIDILSKEDGVWREPKTKTPDQNGNTVIAGHRFQYLPGNSNTLYLLDKMTVGDTILVHWKGREYQYTIYDMFEVTPDRVDIRNDTEDKELTIYTCAPIGSTSHRLVVKAKQS